MEGVTLYQQPGQIVTWGFGDPPLLTTNANTSLTHHSFSLSLPFIITAARHLDLSVSVFRGNIYMCHVDSIILPGLHPKSPE